MSKAPTLKLRLEELLTEELATYYLGKDGDGNDLIVPAISVVPPLVQDTTIDKAGVECWIYEKPIINKPELLCENTGTHQYRVTLRQFDLNKTLENCQLLISEIFYVNWQEKIQERKSKTNQTRSDDEIIPEQVGTLIDENKVDFDDPLLISTIADVVTRFYV